MNVKDELLGGIGIAMWEEEAPKASLRLCGHYSGLSIRNGCNVVALAKYLTRLKSAMTMKKRLQSEQ